MDARAYQPSDLDACLAILTQRGLSGQREAFVAALATADFVVLEHDSVILACGGIADANANEAELVWGMVDPAWERKGLGRFLLLYRSRLCRAPFLAVTVPPQYAAFYEKAGFRPTGTLGRLVKKMEVCA